MVIHSNSGRIRKYRKLIVELLLAAHCRDCTTCVKSGECVLQELAHRLGVENVRFQNTREQRELDLSSPSLVRDPNKCILCGNCVRACEELQSIGALGFAFRGTEAMVMPAFDRKISTTDCVNCGQCRVFCPTGAISIRTNMDEVWKLWQNLKCARGSSGSTGCPCCSGRSLWSDQRKKRDGQDRQCSASDGI